MIERYEIDDWENHPVTLHLKRLITIALNDCTQRLAAGELLDLPNLGNKYHFSVGFIKGLQFVLDAELAEERESETIRGTEGSRA